ncbi:hypothetical protein [Paenibacillus jilunlii]|uniref:hypothetical protein n=1 Tax=Paenibacillus jilunlii TaxID=682956 RepID=UPI0012FB325C|nr:hypothetical protein [Paenibacillus jilunlii]
MSELKCRVWGLKLALRIFCLNIKVQLGSALISSIAFCAAEFPPGALEVNSIVLCAAECRGYALKVPFGENLLHEMQQIAFLCRNWADLLYEMQQIAFSMLEPDESAAGNSIKLREMQHIVF